MRFRTAFRIFYSTFYYVLYLVLLVLCLVTPADLVRQAYARDNHQFYNIIVVCGAVGLTLCLALLIGITRWKTNSNVLKSIPKQWIPIEKEDVNRSVRKMIVASLSRSAAIAWDARPRVDPQPPTIVSGPDTRDAIARPPEPGEVKKKGCEFSRKRTGRTETEVPVIVIPSHKPVWGDISHNGWSSPVSPDLPNLQYVSVVLELPHLIEAKAVSLAPPDPDSNSDPPMPDIQVIQLLQRPAAMGLRDYIGHLINIGIITSTNIATDFLNAYERARFSAQPLSEQEFRDLMKQFAELLRNMNSLDAKEFDLEPPESDIDDDGSSSLTPATPRSRSVASSRSTTSRSPSEGTIRTAPSRRPGTKNTNRTTEFGTAPATPRSRKTSRAISRSPSSHSFAQTRRPYTSNSGTSSDSLRSGSQGSVIKLSRTNESGDLPYTLTVPGASTQKTYSWESHQS